MNLILEKTDQVCFFTDMALVFKALGLSAADYDWYVSDIETNCSVSVFSQNNRWISGRELQEFLNNSDAQFIWAVFSAVPKGHRHLHKLAQTLYTLTKISTGYLGQPL